jgi:Zn-dependent protease with chaperone function
MKQALITILFFCLATPCFSVSQTAARGKSANEPVAATEARQAGQSISFYALSPEQLRKSEALYKTRTALYLIQTTYGIAVLAVLLRLRIASRYRGWAERLAHRRLFQAAIFIPLLFITLDLVSLPFELYRHHMQLAFELSVQSWGSWGWDRAKAELVRLLFFVPAGWGLYALIKRSPARWWIYSWLVSLPLVVGLVFVAPILIDPLFSHFVPLQQTRPELVSAIEQVAARGGLMIPRARIFEMNASEKVTTYNAYVTGIASTKRVVVWDNTARDLTVPEVLFIFGHEMGHYVLDHIYKGLAFAAGLLLAGLAAAKIIADNMLLRWGQLWGVHGLSDWASLPALMLVFSVLAFLGAPVANGFSRHLEHQADIYGLEVTHGIVPDASEVAARDFQLLGEKSLSYPNPNRLLVFWTYNHPPVAERLRFALNYSPWAKNQPTKYVH